MVTNRKRYNSDICIDGKRICAMRELAKEAFEESFLSIEVEMPSRIFVIRVDDTIDINKLNKFESKYKLCKVIVYQTIDSSMLKGIRKK